MSEARGTADRSSAKYFMKDHSLSESLSAAAMCATVGWKVTFRY
jgi:hypothetical protein